MLNRARRGEKSSGDHHSTSSSSSAPRRRSSWGIGVLVLLALFALTTLFVLRRGSQPIPSDMTEDPLQRVPEESPASAWRRLLRVNGDRAPPADSDKDPPVVKDKETGQVSKFPKVPIPAPTTKPIIGTKIPAPAPAAITDVGDISDSVETPEENNKKPSEPNKLTKPSKSSDKSTKETNANTTEKKTEKKQKEKESFVSLIPSTTPFILHEQYHLNDTSSTKACAEQYDFKFMHNWDKEGRVFCEGQSDLTCRVITNPHLPGPTAPHTVCDAHGLVIDFSKMKSAHCLRHRPGYFCLGSETYWEYAPGALQAQCKKTDAFTLEKFPRDHLRDIFDSFETTEIASEVQKVPGVTLFVTRERGEHVNVFHTSCDWFNAFMTLEMLQVDTNEVQLVLLDEHVDGPLDDFWSAVVSPNKPVKRARDFLEYSADGKTLRQYEFEHALFSPPGYSSLFIVNMQTESAACQSRLDAVASFAHYALARFGLPPPVVDPSEIKILFTSRRPYNIPGVEHKYVARQMDNEDELLAILRAVPSVTVTMVDFAHKSLREQIRIVSEHDMLIGMHGAGLSHLLWLPDHAAVYELRPKHMGWYCFKRMAEFRGLRYLLWENGAHPKNWREDENGDYTTVDTEAFKRDVLALIEHVTAAKHREALAARQS